MHGSISGPLGALLLIAPLAAIPVFAIVGVPQFAPVVASSSDDDDFDAPADLGDSTVSLDSSVEDRPAPARAADDIFAPYSEPSRNEAPAGARPSARQLSDSRSSSGHPPRTASTLPPPDALDHWEIRPGAGNTPGGRNSGDPAGGAGTARGAAPSTGELQIPVDELDDGQVSAEGFSPDLLKLDSSGVRKAGHGTPRATPDKPPVPSRESQTGGLSESAGNPPRTSDLFPEQMSEQSGWQAAARHLKDLGIRKYRLLPRLEDVTFTFTCFVPSPDDPRVSRSFEAEADTPLEAVQEVLAQIDDWRAGNSRNKVATAPAGDLQDP